MRWLELSVEADVEAVEAVSEILGRVSEGTSVHPTRLLNDPDDELAVREDPSAPFVVTAHLEEGPTSADAVEATERALWHLQAFGLRPVGGLVVRTVDDASWSEAWKQHYVPQRIGRLVVVPSWIEEPPRAGEVRIVLDPGMAFGTGLHPTTRGCLELIQELDPMPPRVLDVGTGSGILAIAALMLGAESAVGVDTDALAVEASRANAERNAVAERFVAVEGSLAEVPDETYPLIVANLVAALLVRLALSLAARLVPTGVLVASGIIEPRATAVVDAMHGAGLAVRRRRDDGEWVSLQLARDR
jgi:ribosomal protein L11 methyltransferase